MAVRAPNWIGDVVLSLPALRDVRRNFPRSRIEVVARPWVADLYGSVAEIDEVRAASGLAEETAVLAGGYDLALLLPNSFATAWAARRAGVAERWGYATDARHLLLTRRPPVPASVRGINQVFYYRALLAGLGLRVSARPDARIEPTTEWVERAAKRLGEGEWVGINPGAFYGSAKRWLPERFGAIADRLRRRGFRVAVLGGHAELPLGKAIAEACGPGVSLLCGETGLGELVGVLSRLRLLVTGDSGPMHLAAAVGCAVVAVVGSTDWRETAPYTDRVRTVQSPVACAPCMLRECPIDHRCMTGVGVTDVWEAIEATLETTRPTLGSNTTLVMK